MKPTSLGLFLVLSFLLGIHEGKIALWRSGETRPEAVFPYRAEYLPIQDQRALEKGIPIESEAELQRLLEDYLS